MSSNEASLLLLESFLGRIPFTLTTFGYSFTQTPLNAANKKLTKKPTI